jgi:hypothetical protein
MENVIGKFVNRYGWSDIYPVGRIIGIKGKKTLIIRRIIATEQIKKMNFIVGGFSAHCSNNYSQEWIFEEQEEIIEKRIGKQFDKQYRIDENIRNFYDYNF